MSAKRLLIVGSADIRLSLPAPYIPAPNETMISRGGYSFTPGGSGANAAVAAKNLGVDVILCSRVGDDAYGDSLLELFARRGIDTRCIKTDKRSQTGLAVALRERGGTSRTLLFPGASENISAADVESAFDYYPDAVLTRLDSDPNALISAADCARDEGLPLFVDAGRFEPDFPLSKLKSIEIFSPNESETERLTGIRPNSLENCLRASMALCAAVKINYVVLKLGARGCYVYDGKFCDLISPYDVDAVDAAGVGDAFTAALAAEYLRTGDIIASAKLANAVGAVTASRHGELNAIPTREEAVALVNGEKES